MSSVISFSAEDYRLFYNPQSTRLKQFINVFGFAIHEGWQTVESCEITASVNLHFPMACEIMIFLKRHSAGNPMSNKTNNKNDFTCWNLFMTGTAVWMRAFITRIAFFQMKWSHWKQLVATHPLSHSIELLQRSVNPLYLYFFCALCVHVCMYVHEGLFDVCPTRIVSILLYTGQIIDDYNHKWPGGSSAPGPCPPAT